MKRNKLLCLLLLSLSLCTTKTYAQPNEIGVGLRPSFDGGGITGKFFLDHNFAIEAQLNAGGLHDGNSVTGVGLLEYHIDLPAPGWRIFFGAGIHFGSWDRYPDEWRHNGDEHGIFGIDAVGGVEYRFKNIPLGLSADLKPALNLAPQVDVFPHNIFGIAGRFYFGGKGNTVKTKQRG